MAKDKTLKATITAKGTEIAVISIGSDNDYISLTDVQKSGIPCRCCDKLAQN